MIKYDNYYAYASSIGACRGHGPLARFAVIMRPGLTLPLANGNHNLCDVCVWKEILIDDIKRAMASTKPVLRAKTSH
jgi:hypothetical protein